MCARQSYEFEFTDKNKNFLGEAVFSLSDITRSNGVVGPKIMGNKESLGIFDINYMVIKPFRHSTSPAGTGINQMSGNAAKVWKEKSRKKIVHSGHRGLGVGERYDLA